MPNQKQWASSKARQALYASLRRSFTARGFEEVETPLLVPAAGMEPHINPFRVRFLPELDRRHEQTLFLHTSPEYAMKRLLADGCGPVFQICKVFRNGEVAAHHNPEFTLLEFYRPHADYRDIMADLEALLAEAEAVVAPGKQCFRLLPYERLTVRDALLRETGIDLRVDADAESLGTAARRIGVKVEEGASFDDAFFQLFLEKVEPKLGLERPTFLIDYPASMAALSRLKPEDPTVAERVELYAGGRELGNGFSELTDPVEQRHRLLEEQRLRASLGREPIPLDEPFLEALAQMPPAGGIAVGLDRVLMMMLEVERIDEVLLFPAHDFIAE